jgi:hypothetical protein
MHLEPMIVGKIDVAAPTSAGVGPLGHRLIFPITSGTFEGAGPGRTFRGMPIEGTIQNDGGDWTLVRDAVSRLDIRVTLRTPEGFAIYAQAHGMLIASPEFMKRAENPDLIFDFDQVNFRTQLRFETGDLFNPATGAVIANPYVWINDLLAVGEYRVGPAYPGSVAPRWLEFRWHVLA